ncbi:hypothetical protein EDM53_02795 [Rickettsiales endosymbiont of Peranema trichophorum]|uniref:hypothetical protein n=1 Tax=Rickettsiales endosymbiont of Peranema trichophorum TaxID=2486577 RepID=UPI00102319B3|nr:hypothetical protein [Rickettsiales endosymbiont of Peranema trichophorum]RZI47278.1 hypothetical protein EDM53_02795 [Rickettsiales endosymbiont of Peranema trichophorum]
MSKFVAVLFLVLFSSFVPMQCLATAQPSESDTFQAHDAAPHTARARYQSRQNSMMPIPSKYLTRSFLLYALLHNTFNDQEHAESGGYSMLTNPFFLLYAARTVSAFRHALLQTPQAKNLLQLQHQQFRMIKGSLKPYHKAIMALRNDYKERFDVISAEVTDKATETFQSFKKSLQGYLN